MKSSVPILAFVGASGSGKTTLLEYVIQSLCDKGLSVGVIKHSGGFEDPDRSGKDSHRLRQAGARALVLGSPSATVSFRRHDLEPSFAERLALLPENLDLVLVESYKKARLPCIEVVRKETEGRSQLLDRPYLQAIAADFAWPDCPVPCLSLERPEEVVVFVEKFMRRKFRQVD